MFSSECEKDGLVPGVARCLREAHLQLGGQKRTAAREQLGHAQHQQPQLPHPQEVLPGRGGLQPRLPSRRGPQGLPEACHLRQGPAEAAE